jgi:flavin-dependent dehydrogenase
MGECNKTCDVAIIGAGPDGSSLAFWLGQTGLEVILMDEEHFPRDKVCAGFVG